MNTSHTEDHSIPPKGVEVIGDLAPGTPWWDADVLGIRFCWDRLVWALTIMTPVALYTAIFLPIKVVGFCSLASSSGLGEDWWACGKGALAWVIMWPTIGVIYLGLVSNWLRRYSHIIHQDRVVVKSVWKTIATWINSKTKFGEVDFARMGKAIYHSGHHPRTFGFVFHYARFIFTSGQPGKERTRLGKLYLNNSVVDRDTFVELINYRVDKARGENPPPPEFH